MVLHAVPYAPVQAQVLRLRFDPLSLLGSRLMIIEATVDGLRLAPSPVPAPAAAFAQALPAPRVPKLTQLPEIRDARIRLRYPGDGISWSLFELDAGPIDYGGPASLTADLVVDGHEPRLQGSLQLSAELQAAAEQMRISGLQLLGSDLAVGEGEGLALALTADLDLRVTDSAWRVADLQIDSGALHLQAELSGRSAENGPEMSGSFRLQGFDLRRWMQQHGYGPGRGADATLRCAAAWGRFALSGQALSLQPLALRVDDTAAAGVATFAPDAGGRLALAIDRLSLDPYLTPAAGSGQPTAGGGTESAGGEDIAVALADCEAPEPELLAPPALPAPGGADRLAARIQGGELRLGGLRYGGLSVDAERAGSLTSTEASATDFYGGQVRVALRQDIANPHRPHHVLRARAADVEIAALASDLRGSYPVTGTGDIVADLAAEGADLSAIKADLAGTVSVSVRDGRVTALDLTPLVTATGGDAADAAAATRFDRLSATATGRHGVFETDDIAGGSETLRLSGSGRFDVPAETLDLDLEAVFVEPGDGPGLRGLGGVRVPVAVTGDWHAPRWQPDLGPALRTGAGRLLDRHRDTLKRIEEGTGIKGLEQGLRGLLGL
jgi:hypothetical protein